MSERPRVLCIAGSPRRGGNSDTLLDAFSAGVEEAGGAPGRLVVASAGIGACSGCDRCRATGECAVADPMRDVYPRLDEADAIAVSTPVYFASVPAQLKALVDRLQPYWVRRYVLDRPVTARRPGAIMVVRGGGDPYGYECAERVCRSALGILGVDPVEVVIAEDADARGEIGDASDVLMRAREAGRRIASGLTHRRSS